MQADRLEGVEAATCLQAALEQGYECVLRIDTQNAEALVSFIFQFGCFYLGSSILRCCEQRRLVLWFHR